MAVAQVLTQFENLPQDVKDKLAELDLELSEGRTIMLLSTSPVYDLCCDGIDSRYP